MGKRGRKVVFAEEVVAGARKIINAISYRDDTLMAFSILLTASGMDYQATGKLLGVSEATVKRMNRDFAERDFAGSQAGKSGWGGDRRSILSFEEESEVLDSLGEESRQGHLVTVSTIKAAIEAKSNSTISLQTAYNILYRHKWRKVVPDKVHPKNEPWKLDEFKKKRFPTRCSWQPGTPSRKE